MKLQTSVRKCFDFVKRRYQGAWEAGLFCPVAKRWFWKDLKARRKDAVDKEAPRVLAQLILESANRAQVEANKFTVLASELRDKAKKFTGHK